ncbi:patatin (plasmid) [Fulvitalea axinellae]|uniref:Patatin n=1 Tax=Fulvitalea axinellae TaxID=1182444 RepID=A0AAU9CUC3_9BACT|nr:patatin [Fulvitalea axinellae]
MFNNGLSMYLYLTLRVTLVSLVLFSVSIFCNGQTGVNTEEDHPKIGLCLSGGGAKGLAHIALLEALDSLGIPVDYISGTSMGAIMGGLYSIGYSGDSIERVARGIDWEEILTNQISLRNVGMDEKGDYDKYIFELPLENGKVKIPRGLIAGQNLSLKLSEVYAPAYRFRYYKDFPRGFACVATDILTGKEAVLKSGNLAKNVRASMAVPTVFTPVTVGDRLLADGGMVRNLPALNLKPMGADIIISSDVAGMYKTKEDLRTFAAILYQCSTFKNRDNFPEEVKASNLYIKHDLKGLNSADFFQADSIIEYGRESVKQYLPKLQELADSLRKYPSTKVNVLDPVDTIRVAAIKVTGTKQVNESFVLSKLNLKKGRKVSLKDLQERIRLLYGTRFYELITYELEPHSPPNNVLIRIELHERSSSNFGIALHYDNDEDIGLIVRWTANNVLGRRTKFRLKANISEYPIVRTNYEVYAGRKQNVVLGVFGDYERTELPLSDVPTAPDFNNDYIGVGFRAAYMSELNFGFGSTITYEYFSTRGNIANLLAPDMEFKLRDKIDDLKVEVFMEQNSLDRQNFPRVGKYGKVTGSFYRILNQDLKVNTDNEEVRQKVSNDLVAGDQIRLDAFYKAYIPLTYQKTTFIFGFGGGLSFFDNDHGLNSTFLLGGFNDYRINQIPFIGVLPKAIQTQQFAMANLGLQYELFRNVYLIPELSGLTYGLEIEDLFNQDDLGKETAGVLLGYGLTVGAHTIGGPLKITFMGTTQNKFRVFLNLGYTF